jgi:AraC family transcriptional regulator
MRRVLLHIWENLHRSDAISLAGIAREMNTSPYHLHRIFRRLTGESIGQHIIRLRMELAAYRLLTTDAPICEIAVEAGYSAHEAFTRAFKQSFGMSPRVFRDEVSSGSETHLEQLRMRCSDRWPLGSPPTLAGPSQLLAFMSYLGHPRGIPSVWRRLRDWFTSHEYRIPDLQAIGIMHDSPEYQLERNVRYDACVMVPAPAQFTLHDDIGIQVLPHQVCGFANHHGPQLLIPQTYIRLVLQLAIRGGRQSIRTLPYYEMYARFPSGLDAGMAEAQICVPLTSELDHLRNGGAHGHLECEERGLTAN